MSKTTFYSINYIKALAILFVILNHSLTTDEILDVGGPFWIYMAVPMFMIVSGFNMFNSMSRRKMTGFNQYFNVKYFLPKIINVIAPWFIALLIILIYHLLLSDITIIEYINHYILNFRFPGGYYIPILIQFYFLFPFLYFMFLRNRRLTVLLMVCFHLSFDYFVNLTSLNTISSVDNIYRISILRYFVFILAGMLLAYNIKRIVQYEYGIYLSSLISIIYIYINSYTNFEINLFDKWSVTALPTVFLALSLVVFIFKKLPTIKINLLNIIGFNTYFIFIVQMVYFESGINQITKQIIYQIIGLPLIISILLDLLVCVIVGIVFSRGYKYISAYLLQRNSKLMKTVR